MRFPIQVLVLCLTAAVAGCEILKDDAVTYDGHYEVGFEVNSFKPCGLQEAWVIVAGNDEEIEKLIDLTHEVDLRDSLRDSAESFARLQGRTGRKGKYGHLQSYEREFELQKVIDVHPAHSDDCEP